MIALSPATRARLTALFRAEDAEMAECLLARECAETLPLSGGQATPTSLERIRFAAIRVSGGDLEQLRRAVQLAQTDWRDLLVAANFAEDTGAHQRWRPRRLDSQVSGDWLAGKTPDGVKFARHDAVSVLVGPHAGSHGAVIELLALEPGPRYRVELISGQAISLPEASLGKLA